MGSWVQCVLTPGMDLAKFSLVGLKGGSMHSGLEVLSEFQTHYSDT